jgi:hypothetical protein
MLIDEKATAARNLPAAAMVIRASIDAFFLDR